MWKCPVCETENWDNSNFCAVCGRAQVNVTPAPSPRKKANPGLIAILLVCVLALLGGLICLGSLLLHRNAPAPSVPLPAPTQAAPVTTTPQTAQAPQAEESAQIQEVAPAEEPAKPEDVDSGEVPEEAVSASSSVTPAVPAPTDPLTAYGMAYRDYVNLGTYYQPEAVYGLITDAYYSRRDGDAYRPGHAEGRDQNSVYGYDFGFHYADGLLYFVEVRDLANPAVTYVKLYYWGDELLGYRDYRTDTGDMRYSSWSDYAAVQAEFSYVYDLGRR